MFYNTTNEKNPALKEYHSKSEKQKETIKEFFNNHPEWFYTPSEVWRLIFPPSVPITSIRRAMTDLTKENFLTMTQIKVMSPWGRPEHKWVKNEKA